MTTLTDVWICGRGGELARASTVVGITARTRHLGPGDPDAGYTGDMEIVATLQGALEPLALTRCTAEQTQKMLADLAHTLASGEVVDSDERVLFVQARHTRPRTIGNAWEVVIEPTFYQEDLITR